MRSLKKNTVFGIFAFLVLSVEVSAADSLCFTTKAVTNGGKLQYRSVERKITIDLKMPDVLKAGSEVTFDARGSTVPSGNMEAGWTDFHPDFVLVSSTPLVKVYKVPNREADFNGNFTVTDLTCGYFKTVRIETIKVRF